MQPVCHRAFCDTAISGAQIENITSSPDRIGILLVVASPKLLFIFVSASSDGDASGLSLLSHALLRSL